MHGINSYCLYSTLLLITVFKVLSMNYIMWDNDPILIQVINYIAQQYNRHFKYTEVSLKHQYTKPILWAIFIK